MRVQPNNSLLAQSARANLEGDGVLSPTIAQSGLLPMRLIRFPGLDNLFIGLAQPNEASQLLWRTRFQMFRQLQTGDRPPRPGTACRANVAHPACTAARRPEHKYEKILLRIGAQEFYEKNIVMNILEVLPPVEDRVVLVAGRVPIRAAAIKLQHRRGREHDAQVWELLHLGRLLMRQDQRLRMRVVHKHWISEMPLAMTSKCIFHDTHMTCIGIASDMQVSGKTKHYLSKCPCGDPHVHGILVGGRPAPPEGYGVRYKLEPALVGLRPWSSTSAGTTRPTVC